MERNTTIDVARKIMGLNFIGPDELLAIKDLAGIHIPDNISIPFIPFSESDLEHRKNDYLLILGMPFFKDFSKLTIIKMRSHFGIDPEIKEPCFYNQDWYLNEKFAYSTSFSLKWYLIKKEVYQEYRGVATENIPLSIQNEFPEAVLCCYFFFVFYFHSKGDILWMNDFVWCKDQDHFTDQIYIGRYSDSSKKNKNGFNIHRHLSIKKWYSCVDVIS